MTLDDFIKVLTPYPCNSKGEILMDLGTYICLGFIIMMLVALIIVKISMK